MPPLVSELSLVGVCHAAAVTYNKDFWVAISTAAPVIALAAAVALPVSLGLMYRVKETVLTGENVSESDVPVAQRVRRSGMVCLSVVILQACTLGLSLTCIET